MNKCHELMNAGLKSHRTKTDYGIQEAISKYEEALKHVPETGTLNPDRTRRKRLHSSGVLCL